MKTQSIFRSVLDILACFVVFVLAITISTIGLTIKANQYKAEERSKVIVTVYKKPIPVLASAKGIVEKVHIRPGQEVKRGDVLIEIDNPLLKGKIEALKNYPDNLSARTEAEVAQIELSYLNISSPVDGVVSEIAITEGAPIQELAPLITLYSNEDVSLVANLYTDQYLAIKQLNSAKAYSPRLNQTFMITPSLVRPDIQLPEVEKDEKKIGLYFTLSRSDDATSLLQNEDLQLEIIEDVVDTSRPIDIITNFWNSVLFKPE